MVTVDTVTLDGITKQAREIRFGRVLLTVIASLLYGIGWITARAFGVLWLALTWSAVAVKVGWQEGRRKSAPKRT
jgi:hypothetical protein